MARISRRRRSDAVALVQVLGVRFFSGVTNISSAISPDSWLTRSSGNTPASRTAHRLTYKTDVHTSPLPTEFAGTTEPAAVGSCGFVFKPGGRVGPALARKYSSAAASRRKNF